MVGTYGDLTKTYRCPNTALQYLSLRVGTAKILKIGWAFAHRRVRFYRAPAIVPVTLGASDVRAPVLGAPASALAPAHCSPANLRALGASAIGCGRMLYLHGLLPAHQPRGSSARGNAGSPCDAARFRGVPQRRVAARLASVAGYAAETYGASYKSVRLSPIIIGVVVSVCHAEIFDFGQLLRT